VPDDPRAPLTAGPFTLVGVLLLHNELLARQFEDRYRLLGMVERSVYARAWPRDDGLARRRRYVSRIVSGGGTADTRLLDLWGGDVSSRALAEARRAGLDLAWHGSDEAALLSVGHIGFLSLGKRNTGWWGRGVYVTHHALHASFYAGGWDRNRDQNQRQRQRGVSTTQSLLLCWILRGRGFPVLRRMDGGGGGGVSGGGGSSASFVGGRSGGGGDETSAGHSLRAFHGGYPGHDSHLALVGPGGMALPPDGRGHTGPVYDEIVLIGESQILPYCLVRVKLDLEATGGVHPALVVQ
jgi:uncharacterized membrane protein YgcG